MLLSNEPCFNNFCFKKEIIINSRPKAVFYTGGREKIRLISVRLGRALAGGARPRRIKLFESPLRECHTNKKTTPLGSAPQ